jgi:sodium/potassium-transporting ATPase subunit alpha
MVSVNENSIMALKKRALRRTRTFRRDSETQENVRPNVITRIVEKIRTPFTRIFWEDLFESSESETLVDGKLLSYSYIEAGLIETMGW